jgi:2-polyprenyl-3-methyl-5-hydroxy-6-metoxy-1,4-benzoquinol methylase
MYQDGQYLTNNPTWHEQDSPHKARWIASILQRRLISPKTVAEVGCGAAGILRNLAEIFPEASFDGWDVSPQVVQLANAKPHPRLGIHLDDILGSGRVWDLLLAIDVLEHMENPAEFLRESRKLCGWATIHLPLDLSVQTVFRGYPLLDLRRNLGHIHMFTRGTARALMEENGWEILEEAYTGGSLELPLAAGLGNFLKNWPLRLPRRLLFAMSPHLAVRFLGGWSILLLCRPRGFSHSAP